MKPTSRSWLQPLCCSVPVFPSYLGSNWWSSRCRAAKVVLGDAAVRVVGVVVAGDALVQPYSIAAVVEPRCGDRDGVVSATVDCNTNRRRWCWISLYRCVASFVAWRVGTAKFTKLVSREFLPLHPRDLVDSNVVIRLPPAQSRTSNRATESIEFGSNWQNKQYVRSWTWHDVDRAKGEVDLAPHELESSRGRRAAKLRRCANSVSMKNTELIPWPGRRVAD